MAWTPISPVAGGRCGQFLQKLGLEKQSILTATTAHTAVFAAAGHSTAAQAQHFSRVMAAWWLQHASCLEEMRRLH